MVIQILDQGRPQFRRNAGGETAGLDDRASVDLDAGTLDLDSILREVLTAVRNGAVIDEAPERQTLLAEAVLIVFLSAGRGIFIEVP
jgi:hypothetical protein